MKLFLKLMVASYCLFFISIWASAHQSSEVVLCGLSIHSKNILQISVGVSVQKYIRIAQEDSDVTNITPCIVGDIGTFVIVEYSDAITAGFIPTKHQLSW